MLPSFRWRGFKKSLGSLEDGSSTISNGKVRQKGEVRRPVSECQIACRSTGGSLRLSGAGFILGKKRKGFADKEEPLAEGLNATHYE